MFATNLKNNLLSSFVGPERFYFENGKLPKLLMTVKEGIHLTVFKVGSKIDISYFFISSFS